MKHDTSSHTTNRPAAPHAGEPGAKKPAKGPSAHEALRKNAMMSNLLDALDRGDDIGHYGKLVFAMIAQHFMSDDELVAELGRCADTSEEKARALVHQVRQRDYSPPRRERILEWQAKQSFLIVPDDGDPNAGNVYKDLEFPERVYEHIEEYHEHAAS